MKKLKLDKEKIKRICIGIVFIGIIFSGKVFATDFEVKLTEDYKKWDKLTVEEKKQTLMPQTILSEVPSDVLDKYKTIDKAPRLVKFLVGEVEQNLQEASPEDSKFNLADKLALRVEYQGKTTECWAFSTLKSLETNIALKNGDKEIGNFSERHMDYATSRSFVNGINEQGLLREVSEGGLPISGLAYLTNGQGAVLEKDMPFEDNQNKINLNDINKTVDTVVTDYVFLPTINKKYNRDSDGNTISVEYYNSNGELYSEEDLKIARKIIKEHLIKYGAIATMNGGNYTQFYNNQVTPKASTAYNCNDTSKVRDHAITIVGWDDNYAKENFAVGAQPSTNGAYIVLNSYGESAFDKGYMYVSYEDTFVENELYGIKSSTKVDYDKMYQHDFFGGIYQIGSKSAEKGYYGVTYERDENKKETLNSIGITIPTYANVNIYVNPNNTSMNFDDLIRVGNSHNELEPGYHRININPIELKGKEFAIVVEQISADGSFYFSVEANVPGTAYSAVGSDNRSFISLDSKTWTNLSDLSVSIDTKKADVCVKAFTTEEKSEDNPGDNTGDDNDNNNDNKDEITISSNKYKIEDTYIKNISYETSISDFIKNIETNSESKIIIEKDGNEISNNSEIVKTGMKLKLSDNKEYTLIVRGDIKEDGKITVTDISKLILHYNEMEGFELKDNQLKAADMNIDGQINLVDVSQMIVLYNSI